MAMSKQRKRHSSRGHETELRFFQDWDNRLDPGEWRVDCTCGYESRTFTSKRDAENDEYEHYTQAHQEG
jgi:hypothetical protein